MDPPDPVVGVRVNPDPDLFRITLELESDGFPDPDTEPTDFLFFALATEVAVETKLCARLLFTEKKRIKSIKLVVLCYCSVLLK